MSMKTCSTCRDDKPTSEYHRSRSTSDGLDPRCKPCRKTASATHALAVGLKRKGQHLRLYGVSVEQYAALVEAQDNLCAICELPETMTYQGKVKSLSIDHDHATGKVRGLLCAACNFALGKFKDSPALLRSAANYLER
jgi:hypothetical protein